jgi:hypothetical protein
MAGLFRKLGVSIAILCIVLMLLFLTVKEVGRFCQTLDPGTELRVERASVPEEASLLFAALVVAAWAVHMFRNVLSLHSTVIQTPCSAPLSFSPSTLR